MVVFIIMRAIVKFHTFVASQSEPGTTVDVTATGYTKGDIVCGNINMTSLTANNSLGTNGQILSSTGSGLSWIDNTTYSVGDGGLTQKNFTTDLNTKLTNLPVITTIGSNLTLSGGTLTSTNTTYSVGDGGLTQKNFTTDLNTKLNNLPVITSIGSNLSLSGGTLTATNTTYSVGDGGLTQNNFTDTLKSKLDSLQIITTIGSNLSLSGGTLTATNTTYSVGDGGLTQNNFTDTLKSKLDSLQVITTIGSNLSLSGGTLTATNTTYSVGDGGLTQKNFTTDLNTKLNNLPVITSIGSNLSLSGGTLSATGGGSSVWTTSGSNIYYNSGNVGIGSSYTPQAKLEVNVINYEHLSLYYAPSEPVLRVMNTSIAHQQATGQKCVIDLMRMGHNTSHYGPRAWFTLGRYTGGSGSNASTKLNIDLLESGSQNALTTIMTLQSNGKIGIGNTNPSYNLDVSGDINLTGSLRINGVAQSFGGGSSVWTSSSNNIYWNGSGNIGVGITSPEFPLQISYENAAYGTEVATGGTINIAPMGPYGVSQSRGRTSWGMNLNNTGGWGRYNQHLVVVLSLLIMLTIQ